MNDVDQYFYFSKIIDFKIKYKYNCISCVSVIYENKILILWTNDDVVDCYDENGKQLKSIEFNYKSLDVFCTFDPFRFISVKANYNL